MHPDDTPRDVALDPALLTQIRIPAVFLIIVGGLNALAAIALVFFGRVYVEIGDYPPAQFAQWRDEIRRMHPDAARQFDQAEQDLQGSGITLQELLGMIGRGSIVWAAIAAIPAVVIIVGGVQMARHRGYGLALTSSILSSLPVISPLCFCLVGLGVGIWALVVLLQPQVKQAFAVGTPSALPPRDEGWGTSGDEGRGTSDDEGWGSSGEDRFRNPPP